MSEWMHGWRKMGNLRKRERVNALVGHLQPNGEGKEQSAKGQDKTVEVNDEHA